MICFHNWQHIGLVAATQYLFGVPGPLTVEVEVEAKKCIKCKKVKAVS